MPSLPTSLPRTVLLLVAVAVLAACSREERGQVQAPVPVTITHAEVRDVPMELSAPGTVETIRSVAVTAQIDGQLLEALVRDGAEVAAGELLFRIDPRPAEAALRQAEAELARNRALLEEARSRVDRYGPVADKGYVSADQMQQYRTALAAARGAVQVGEANVAAARLELGYTEIRAPLGGRLGRIQVQPGNVVRANGATPLVTINQLAPIYVNFAVPASWLGRLLAAQGEAPLAVAAMAPGFAEPVRGEVAFIDNAVDTRTGTIRLRGEFANAGRRLWPGQLVTVTLTLDHDRGAVVLPEIAVRDGPQGSYVFLVDATRRAVQRSVTVERASEGLAVIASGVAPGDAVVLDGQSRLSDGAAVEVAAGAEAAAAEARP